MAKQDIFSKIIRDYNNELEAILEKKDFESDVKNLLLSMLYRIENGYDDYKKVKVNVCDKKQFTSEILETIEKRCNKIEIIKPYSGEGESLYKKQENCIIDKGKGIIKTFQNEKCILDAILQMRQEDIKLNPKFELTNKPIKEMLLIGNNMNSLELITDFNGWSWDITVNGRKNMTYNALYQLLVLLIGNKGIESWINNRKSDEIEEMPSNLIISSKVNETFGITKKEIRGEETDYIAQIRQSFREKYGDKNEKDFFRRLMQISILECAKHDKEYDKEILNHVASIKKELDGMVDNRVFVENLSKKKKKLTKEIEQLDKLISNEKGLKEEYEKRNEKLPKEKKLFSVSYLRLMLKKQRDNKLEEIQEINKKMEPKEYVKVKKAVEDKFEFYDEIKLDKKTKENTERLMRSLQKTFLKCFKDKIEKAETNQEIQKLIYELRYYNLIPIGVEKRESDTKEIESMLIKKACNQKVLTKFSDYDNTNVLLLKGLFYSRIIDIDTIVYVIKYSKGVISITIYDGNTNDDIVQIKIKEKIILSVKLNKKIKIWQ